MANSTSNANNRLAKGTLVYMIGNVSSKVLQMLILPIITAMLSTGEYGTYDLIITTISLVSPIVTCQIIEGMFRFLFDSDEKEKTKTVTSVSFFLLMGILLLGLVVIFLHSYLSPYGDPLLIYLNYIAYIVLNYVQKLSRCQLKNKQFAISGVVNTIVMLSLQVLFLVVFHLGVNGMILATLISHFVASLYLIVFIEFKNLISIKSFDKKCILKLLKYSLPLVPNSIGWWIVASSDRYIISFFIDTAANGIYSIAGKFSQLLTFVTSVFQLAWQESAIMEMGNKDRDIFYSQTFNTYMRLLLGGYIVILPFIALIFPILTDSNYHEGYFYSPILLLGAVFSSFSQFYGSAYLVFKKTGGAFSTTVIAAIINLLIGVGLIKWIGLYAPALGTACSFLIQWILRAFQMRSYFKVKIEKKALILLLLGMIFVTIEFYIGITVSHIIVLLIGMLVFLI